ncbi:MAG TPA: phosphate ABC transporter ATP-binding protein [Vicinamibacterales bacterium]|nr:phosphate ABC transporter ATP-binding protein [Vicinamibacterales bacterium]
MPAVEPHVSFRDVTVRYGATTALDRVTVDIPRHAITAIIGPTRSGKSTFLKCLNRMIDVSAPSESRGAVLIDGEDVFHVKNVHDLRRRVGMVLPLPVALPLSIYDNVALAPRLGGMHDRREVDARVEESLRQAALWDEVKDRLRHPAASLSGGQQQRLAIARALSHAPEILCLDEFSIAIDPIATMRIEDVLVGLERRMTIVMATNLVQQAHRVADQVLFINAGRLVECGATETVFSEHPASHLTFDYVRGRFG